MKTEMRNYGIENILQRERIEKIKQILSKYLYWNSGQLSLDVGYSAYTSCSSCHGDGSCGGDGE